MLDPSPGPASSLLRTWIAYVVVLSLATGTQLFVEPTALSQASGALVPTDYSINQLAYEYTFDLNDLNDLNGSAAISVPLLVVSLALSAVFLARAGLAARRSECRDRGWTGRHQGGHMVITGYRSITTRHEWGRPVGDVNGHSVGTSTRVDIVVVTTDSGVEGVGIGAHPDIERVFPALEGRDPRAVVTLYDAMLALAFKLGHTGAVFGTIGALDHALWDLKAKLAGEPLWRLLGAEDRFVPGYASGLEYALSDDDLVGLYQRFADRGFSSGKLKGGRFVADDVRRLGLVREVFRANSRAPGLMIDANESWHRSQAVRHIAALEAEFDLTWVEEPVRRWDARGLASIRSHVRSAIATGENLTGLEQFRALVDADAVDVVQVGSGWGITHFLRTAALAHAFDLPVSPIGYTTLLAPAAGAVPNFLTAEVQDFGHPVGVRVDQEIADGGIVLGDEPGSGVSVDESRTEAVAVGTGWTTLSGPHARPPRAALRLVPEDDHVPGPHRASTAVPFDPN